MLALGQLAFFGFIALSVVYIVVSIWSRRVRRAKLHARWEEEGHTGDRALFVREGLKEYDRSLRPKLVFLVYIVPLVLVAVLIYVTNFN